MLNARMPNSRLKTVVHNDHFLYSHVLRGNKMVQFDAEGLWIKVSLEEHQLSGVTTHGISNKVP